MVCGEEILMVGWLSVGKNSVYGIEVILPVKKLLQIPEGAGCEDDPAILEGRSFWKKGIRETREAISVKSL